LGFGILAGFLLVALGWIGYIGYIFGRVRQRGLCMGAGGNGAGGCFLVCWV